MARRRRPGSRTSVVDGRARVIIPIEAVETADETAPTAGAVKRWLPAIASVDGRPGAATAVSATVDRFVYEVQFSDVAVESDTHEGEEFLAAVRTHGELDVFVVVGVDPRRSAPDDLSDAGADRRLFGGSVIAFEVDRIDP